jgi:hypothetical protein
MSTTGSRSSLVLSGPPDETGGAAPVAFDAGVIALALASGAG